MGGGTELALACRYRVADEDEAKIGLPEVLLGIQPGWGGSVRLPQLIGPTNALPMMLAGNAVNARKAKKMGLVDAAVPKRQLVRAAKQMIKTKPKKPQLSLLQKFINSNDLSKPSKVSVCSRIALRSIPMPNLSGS